MNIATIASLTGGVLVTSSAEGDEFANRLVKEFQSRNNSSADRAKYMLAFMRVLKVVAKRFDGKSRQYKAFADAIQKGLEATPEVKDVDGKAYAHPVKNFMKETEIQVKIVAIQADRRTTEVFNTDIDSKYLVTIDAEALLKRFAGSEQAAKEMLAKSGPSPKALEAAKKLYAAFEELANELDTSVGALAFNIRGWL